MGIDYRNWVDGLTHHVGGREPMSLPENPYEAPKADLVAIGVKSGQRKDVRKIAEAQKTILICILIQIAFGSLLIASENRLIELPERVLIGSGFVAVGTSLVGMIAVFSLATRVYNTGVGILLGVGALIPCFGLIVLFVVNGKATQILQANGYRVGLLGAKLPKGREH